MPLKIYYINAGLHEYEMLRSVVVIAENENSARSLIMEECGREGEVPWRNAKCIVIGNAIDTEIERLVCADYFEG